MPRSRSRGLTALRGTQGGEKDQWRDSTITHCIQTTPSLDPSQDLPFLTLSSARRGVGPGEEPMWALGQESDSKDLVFRESGWPPVRCQPLSSGFLPSEGWQPPLASVRCSFGFIPPTIQHTHTHNHLLCQESVFQLIKCLGLFFTFLFSPYLQKLERQPGKLCLWASSGDVNCSPSVPLTLVSHHAHLHAKNLP